MQGALQPLLTVLVIGLVFTPLELLLPARRPPAFRWRRYATDLLHLSVGGLLIRLGTTALLALMLAPLGTRDLAAGLPLWLQVALVLVVSDLMFWLAHRLFHAVPRLWAFHKVHHSSAHLDWLAAYRVHPLDQIVNATIIALPALALGFSPAALLIYGLAYQWHAILLHSNVRVSLGPLERLVTTPRFHHWHHADHAEAYDRNFGGQLVIWDKLFGTAYDPPLPRPERYGVDDPPREGFLAHIVTPFIARNARWPS
jgi:sterol desaturase/sphingolipid hydroxylase (fatty acid hydroxylase superfamily)